MFCKNCGQEIAEGATVCPNCNAPVDAAAANAAQPPYGAAPQPPYTQQMPPQQPYGQPYAPYGMPPVSQEPASMGLRVLCWFIPIVGIILYFVKKDEKPVYAKQCGKAALISIIVNVILSFVGSFLLTMAGMSMYY